MNAVGSYCSACVIARWRLAPPSSYRRSPDWGIRLLAPLRNAGIRASHWPGFFDGVGRPRYRGINVPFI